MYIITYNYIIYIHIILRLYSRIILYISLYPLSLWGIFHFMFRRNGSPTGKFWAKWSWRSVYLEWVTQTYQNPTGILHDIQSIPPNEGWISIHGNIWRTMLWDMFGTYKYDYTIWSTTWNGVFRKCRGPTSSKFCHFYHHPIWSNLHSFPNENANFVVDPVSAQTMHDLFI